MSEGTINNNGELDAIEPVSDGGGDQLKLEEPYVVEVQITGAASLLFHAWNTESIDKKAGAAKGSAAKKTDDIESYVVRTEKGEIGLPGDYLRGSIINAARWVQDPRSPRKSAMDLFKAGVIVLDEIATLGKKKWDYISAKRVTVQRSGLTRRRPAFNPGWTATFRIQILTPEYISPDTLHLALERAGRLVGVGDYRPSYGRYRITKFKKIVEA